MAHSNKNTRKELMKYFKVFLNKGNPEVHGQIVYTFCFVSFFLRLYVYFFSTTIQRKLEVHRLHRLYLGFDLRKVGKMPDYKYRYKKPS